MSLNLWTLLLPAIGICHQHKNDISKANDFAYFCRCIYAGFGHLSADHTNLAILLHLLKTQRFQLQLRLGLSQHRSQTREAEIDINVLQHFTS